MSDKATHTRNHERETLRKKGALHPDHKPDVPDGIAPKNPTDNAQDPTSIAEQHHEQNQHAEQLLAQQKREQDDRIAFQKGSAQAHQQGNRQH